MLEIIQIPALSDNYIFLLHEALSGTTAVIDPAEATPVFTVLEQTGWQLNYILNTHHHADHVGGNLELKRQTGCKIVGAENDGQRIPGIDIGVEDGDEIRLGEQSLSVIATPGHTLGHIVYYCRDSEALFCGDTLFSLGCGRLFEGSAEQMWHSLQRLKTLPASTRVYCTHEYTQANGRFAKSLEADNPELQKRLREVESLRSQNRSTLPSTIAQELATNPFFREDSIAIRQSIGAGESETAIQTFARLRQLKDQFH